MVSEAKMTLDANLSNIQVRDRGFYFGVEVSLNVTGIQFNDKCKARGLLVDVLDRLGFPPSPNWVDCEQISASEIGSRTTNLIDVQRANVTPIHTEAPSIVPVDLNRIGIICEPVDAGAELRLAFIGLVQLEPKIMRGVAVFVAASGL